MSLQIRRGPTTDRLTITPAEGELIFDTTEKSLYVGDGTVLGGIATTPTSTGDIENIAAALFTNGIHSNINYQYDNLNDRINSAVDLTSYTGIISADGFKGSIFANNNSLLVDSILGSVELDGTVRSDIVPASNDSYDLGRSSTRFRDLYLSGNTLFLGDAVINAVGSSVSLPAGSTVGGVLIGNGSSGDGVVEGGFYNINIVGDDSSIMVDVNNVSISATGGIIGDVTGNLSGSVLSSDGSSFLVNSFSNSISAPGGIFGDVSGDLRGSVFGLDSSIIVNTFTNEITGNFNGRLSENLDLNGKAIIDNENVFIVPNNYTQFGSVNFNINGNIVIRRSSFTNGILDGLGGFLFEQYHNNFLADRMVFHRSRGSYEAPLPLQAGDRIAEFTFSGNTNELPFSAISSTMRVVADSGPITNLIPTRIEFRCLAQPAESDPRVLVMRPDKIVQVNALEGINTTLQVTGNLIGNVTGDVVGSVFSDDSTRIIDGISGSVTAGSFVQFGSLTAAERNALAAVNGMVIYNTTYNRFEGYQNGSWINLDNGTAAGV